MLFAADYPLLNIFWTMILFFFWIAWIWMLVRIVSDVFRRHDASGWVKAMWLFVLIFVPFFGVLAYMIVNGHGMAERHAAQAAEPLGIRRLRAVGRRFQRRGRRDREGQGAARQRGDHAGRVRHVEGQGARLTPYPKSPRAGDVGASRTRDA